MSTARWWVAAITALGLMAVGAPTAQAETVTEKDDVGDAPAKIDITRVKYAHGDGRVSATAHIPQLGKAGKAALSISRHDMLEAGYVVRIVKKRGEPAKVRLLFFDHFDSHKRACEGVTGTWGASAIRLSVPTQCLEGHATKKVFAQFAIQKGQKIDRAPEVRKLTRS